MNRRKVVVVGAGAVGSTYAYALAQSGLADEIALINMNASLARGQVMDLVHGQPFFPPVSIHVGGVPIDRFCANYGQCPDWPAERNRIANQVRDSAYHIIDYKGATCFAVGLALVRITSAILRSQNSVLTVSTILNGEYGLQDVCLSVPCIVSAKGVEKIVENALPESELAALHASASVLKQSIV